MDEPVDRLVEALRYPWAAGETGVTLVVGGILTLLSPLIIPGLLVLGYGLAVIEAALDGDERPPAFGDWQDRLVEGVKGAVVLLVYVVIPLGVGLAIFAVIANRARLGVGPGLRFAPVLNASTFAVVLVFLLAGLVLVVAYLAPAALVHLARTRRLGAAFAVDDVRGLVAAPAYGAAWLLALTVFAIAGVVLAVLNAAAIGVIVSGFVTFYAFVAMASLYAQGAEMAGFELAPPEADTAASADDEAEESAEDEEDEEEEESADDEDDG